MSAGGSIRAYFGIRPRTFLDSLRLYAPYAVSVLLRILVPSRSGSVGRWVRGKSRLRVSVAGILFDVRPRTNDLDLISPKHERLTTEWFRVGTDEAGVDV